jgi:predicted membrane channel-forming protein YqfA (hemolysin III family)
MARKLDDLLLSSWAHAVAFLVLLTGLIELRVMDITSEPWRTGYSIGFFLLALRELTLVSHRKRDISDQESR